MVNTIETVISSFSECPLPPLEGIPTHDYLTNVNSYLNLCAASVHSKLGNGQLGYLVLMAQPATFALACPVDFIQPINPGATLNLPDPVPPAAVIGTLTGEHSENLRSYHEYNNVDKACKNLF